ncbi:MAG: APC family permease [Streptosporangiaceae bacterium]|nr:APC family permease [Streptosporangiaceae bacterium]
MATTEPVVSAGEQQLEKGLKPGALGLVSSVVMGVASTAPAYSLAATLGLIVVAVGLRAPIVAVLAFVPMLLTSIGYSELNKADPDCGTTFTWATRAFGPRTGWAGGWAIVAADVLVMASLAQVAGQYLFLLFGAKGIGGNPTSGWVLLMGVLWIVAMTYICYRGIEVSARLQRLLLGIEVVMLLVLSVVALVRVGTGHHPAVSIHPSWSWLNPFDIGSFGSFTSGLILMLFIYWGWDTAVAVNEETRDRSRIPGQAAIISTVMLLVTYVLVIFAAQSFAGVGTSGIGLGNSNNSSDVLSVLGSAVFGGSGFGSFLARLLLLMVLSSAAASTQTTILPTARTTLSMAVYKALPSAFARMHPKYLTPTVSTLVMGAISIALYIPFNYMSGGNVIPDAVTAIGLFIAFYYGLTGFACAWYYRRTLTSSARNLWMRGILPALGGLIMYFFGGWALWMDWDVATANSFTTWKMPFYPEWRIGGVFMIAFLSALAGVLVFIYCRLALPAFFRKETLTRTTPTLAPDEP